MENKAEPTAAELLTEAQDLLDRGIQRVGRMSLARAQGEALKTSTMRTLAVRDMLAASAKMKWAAAQTERAALAFLRENS